MAMDRHPLANRFQGKVAFVTGGASGIGRAITQEFCHEGGAVLILDMSEAGQNVADELAAAGHEVLFYHGDVARDDACQLAVAAALKKWGHINYLVNNAFSFIAQGVAATPEDWERSLQVGPVG